MTPHIPTDTIPEKTKLLFRIILFVIIASGVAELVEVVLVPVFPTHVVLFELMEHATLAVLLLLFMTKYVANPLLAEMVLRRASQEQLEKNNLKHRHIIAALPDSVVHLAADGTILDCSCKHGDIIRLEAGINFYTILPPNVVTEFQELLRVCLADGTPRHRDFTFSGNDSRHHLVFNVVRTDDAEATVFIRDITKRKVHEEMLEHLSTHDVLTGLYNRTFYEAELERLLTSRRYPVSIIIVDLDGLKITNDTYGHAAGDRMICKAADVLKNAFRAEDLVARTGGDEFTVLLPDTGADGAEAAVERIHHCLESANSRGDGYEVHLSMGSALAESREKLLGAVKLADLRMYQNKAARKSWGA